MAVLSKGHPTLVTQACQDSVTRGQGATVTSHLPTQQTVRYPPERKAKGAPGVEPLCRAAG